MLGSVDRGVVFELIAALAAGDGKAVVERIGHLREQGLSAAAVLEDMAAALQRMAVRQAVPDMPPAEDDADAAEIARLAALLPSDETQLLYSLCIHGRAELGLAPDEYAGLTMTLLRLLPFKTGAGAAAGQPVAQLGAAPEAQPAEKKTLKSDPAQAPASAGFEPLPERESSRRNGGIAEPTDAALPPDAMPEPLAEEAASDDADAPDAPPDQNAEDSPEAQALRGAPRATPNAEHSTSEHADFWHALVRQLAEQDAITALVRELALQAQLVERTPGGAQGVPERWTLRVENAVLAQSAASADSPARERLQAALAQAGHPVQLRVTAGPVTDNPARRNAIAADARLKAALALLEADPFVQELKRDFGATIVPGSVRPL
jgi:DNA polymerase-3 subunit gamma/tau